MKEVTYEDWQKNPTPREMWVWDVNEKDKVRRKVIYMVKGGPCKFPVMTTTDDDTDHESYGHCAEIEKQRRMTNRELSRWLREKHTREFKYNNGDDNCIHSYLYYYESNTDKEVDDLILIREDDGEWREPLMEE